MIRLAEPMILGDKTAEYNYEEERYRQNDPPFSAYEICDAYISNDAVSERKVQLCLKKMFAELHIDLEGIDVFKAIQTFAHKAKVSTSWRQLIIEGANGFVKLRMFPDTVDHSGIRQGYVHIIFMYLPKRGEEYEDVFESELFESLSLPSNLSDGMVIGFKYPFISPPKRKNARQTLYVPQSRIHYAVVISQRFLKDNQAVPITNAGNLASDNITGKELIKLTHAQSTNPPILIGNQSYTSQDIEGRPKMFGRKKNSSGNITNQGDSQSKSELSNFRGRLEVISVYDPAILHSAPFDGFMVGEVSDDMLADVQNYYNAHKANAVRLLIDQKGHLFRYEESTRKYYDAQGKELIDPEKDIDAPLQEQDYGSGNSGNIKNSYDPSQHARDFITLVSVPEEFVQKYLS